MSNYLQKIALFMLCITGSAAATASDIKVRLVHSCRDPQKITSFIKNISNKDFLFLDRPNSFLQIDLFVKKNGSWRRFEDQSDSPLGRPVSVYLKRGKERASEIDLTQYLDADRSASKKMIIIRERPEHGVGGEINEVDVSLVFDASSNSKCPQIVVGP